jgi:nucleoside-diphosphate-sugar epimerase
MKILISGAAGFVGSHTAELLEHSGHNVMVVDNFSTGRLENLMDFKGSIKACDINDMRLLDMYFDEFKPEAVIHLAAQSAISTAILNPKKDLRVNGIGTLNMVEMALKYDVKRFIFSSTSAVYEPKSTWLGVYDESQKCIPASPYGISKLAAEQYIRSTFDNHLILRYANVYGPRQYSIGENQVVARAFAHFMNGEEFKVVGHGNQKRDMVFVKDIAYANFMALMSNKVGTFNAASGRSVSVNTILSAIAENYEIPAYQWEHTTQDDPRGDVYMDASKIRREIGWKTYISLRQGIELTAEWWNGL